MIILSSHEVKLAFSTSHLSTSLWHRYFWYFRVCNFLKNHKKNLDEYCTWECIQYKKHNFITVFSDLGETWSLAAACFDITRKYAEAVITLLAVSNQIRHSANK